MALEFGLAGRDDDEALRDLLRRTGMPGEIALAFLREPSFFVAGRAGNRETQTMVCRDVEADEIVGLGERSIRAAYVDGQPTALGYLSNLRGAVEWRKSPALARGYGYLRTLHGDGKARFYVTTILEENAEAIALLTSGRGRLPSYEQVGTLITYLLPIHRRRRARSTGADPVRPGGLADALDCLDAWNRRHQFAPVYAHEDLAGTPGLPPAGSQLRLLHGAFLSATDDDPATALALVERALVDRSGRGASYLVLAL